jgi:hypothetical protein
MDLNKKKKKIEAKIDVNNQKDSYKFKDDQKTIHNQDGNLTDSIIPILQHNCFGCFFFLKKKKKR